MTEEIQPTLGHIVIALVEAWLELYTPQDIGSDVEKIKLLKAGIRYLPKPAPDHVRNFYTGVFLRDVLEYEESERHTSGRT